MSTVYGIISNTLYRMAIKDKVSVLPVENFKSTVYNRENAPDRNFSSVIKFNTGDFFAEQSNDEVYKDIIEFITLNQITDIETIFTEFKTAVDYVLSDNLGNVISEGITMVPAKSRDVHVTHALTEDNKLNSRRAKLIENKITISQMIPPRYGIMEETPSGYIFKIKGIKVYGNLTDATKDQYIRHLNPSMINTTFSYSSGTYKGIQKCHVPVFDSRAYQVEFDAQELSYRPATIMVDFTLLMDTFCNVFDDSEIWRIIEQNGGTTTTDPYIYPDDPFKPVVDQRPCPHNGHHHGDHHGPHPYIDGPVPFGPCGPRPPVVPPCHRPPCPPPPHHPHPPVPPCPPPPKPPVVPHPNEHPHHGHMHEDEWCRADEADLSSKEAEVYLVVADTISDEEYDATCMIKIMYVLPYVTDIAVGDYAKKELVLYY